MYILNIIREWARCGSGEILASLTTQMQTLSKLNITIYVPRSMHWLHVDCVPHQALRDPVESQYVTRTAVATLGGRDISFTPSLNYPIQ